MAELLHRAGERAIEDQRGTLLLWMPLGIGTGIGLYFGLRFEPDLTFYFAVAIIAIAALLALRFVGSQRGWVLLAMALVSTGFLDAGLRAHSIGAPVLHGRYYGPVQGRIVAIDRSASDQIRLVLDQVILARRSTSRTPRNIRITTRYKSPHFQPFIGARVILTASLSAPSGPVEPGGFNFQRYAWFRGLGAIGYSRTPVLEIAPPEQAGWAIGLIRTRLDLASAIRARIPGQEGAFAAAILTGDRSAIAPDSLVALRNSNLAHLLAISGLHMGLLTGFVFALVRYGLALFPFVALRVPVKKVAAVAAFIVAVLYLILSGANVATQRAFVMVLVALIAVLLDRRALTLRAVALAAVLVLLMRPESLVQAGFQMSFAATTALVAVFEAIQALPKPTAARGWLRKGLRWGAALILSSTVAGLATAPISAFQFSRIAEFGLIANLASVPVMGFLVMPVAVLAVLVTPLGISGPVWAVMGAGIGWILMVARWVSGLDGAVIAVVKPGMSVLILITVGMLVFILLRGHLRVIALFPVLIGFWMWHGVERPDILLSANGNLLGVNGSNGRWLSKAKGSGFVAKNWLASDGDMTSQKQAAARQKPVSGLIIRRAVNLMKITYSREKSPDIKALCNKSDLLILPRVVGKRGGCRILTASDITRLGAISISADKTSLSILGARQVSGRRLWTGSPAH